MGKRALPIPSFLTMKIRLIFFCCLTLLLSTNACKSRSDSTANSKPQPYIAAKPLPDDATITEEKIRFLEDRIKNDQDDMIAYNMVAGLYLQRLRETGNINYLELATRAANESLRVLPKSHNLGGFALLAEVEYGSHDFLAARDKAQELMSFDPDKIFPYHILTESLLELGDYDKAIPLIKKKERLNDSSANSAITVEIRLARLETLQGNVEDRKSTRLNSSH